MSTYDEIVSEQLEQTKKLNNPVAEDSRMPLSDLPPGGPALFHAIADVNGSDDPTNSDPLDFIKGKIFIFQKKTTGEKSAASVDTPKMPPKTEDFKAEEENKKIGETSIMPPPTDIEIKNIAEWRALLMAIEHHDINKALSMLNGYAAFLAKEANLSFLVKLFSKIIKADSDALIQKLLSIAPVKSFEKAFTFEHLMLPMAYALKYKVSANVIQTLQLAGASMRADYAPDQDVTEQVKLRLTSAESSLPCFASDGHDTPLFENGFTPAFSQHRHSPLIVSLDEPGNDFFPDYTLSAAAQMISPFNGSDLHELQQQATESHHIDPISAASNEGSAHSYPEGEFFAFTTTQPFSSHLNGVPESEDRVADSRGIYDSFSGFNFSGCFSRESFR